MTQTIWQDLLKTALLGTDRTLPTVETLSALSEFGISTEDPTEATLAGAGVFALAQKAGFMLKDFDKNLPDAALDETARPMSAASVRHLQRLLSPDFRLLSPNDVLFLLDEFCHIVSANNRVASPELLPVLLNHWGRLSSVGLIIGERGRWLAAQNPKWRRFLDAKYTPPKRSMTVAAWFKLVLEGSATNIELAETQLSLVLRDRRDVFAALDILRFRGEFAEGLL